MRICGIDPGVSGALAFFDQGVLMHLADMPCLTQSSGKNLPDPIEIGHLMRQWRPDLVVIEEVNAMPGKNGKGGRQTIGATSAFNFGQGFGIVKAAPLVLGIPIQLTRPNAWKQRAGLIGRDKDYARTLALQLYPDASLHRKKDIGRADAILIARYGHQPE